MKKLLTKRIDRFTAVFASCAVMLCLCLSSCADGKTGGSDVTQASGADAGAETETQTAEQESTESKIVGMWIDEGGPVMGNSPVFGDNFQFYEFTSDHKVVYHHLFKDQKGVIGEGASEAGTYRIDEKDGKELLIYEDQNAGAYITIADNVLTMTNDNGETRYTKLTLEETTAYRVYYTDEKLAAEQEEYLADLYAKEDAEKAAAEESSDENSAEETEPAGDETSDSEAPAESETSVSE